MIHCKVSPCFRLVTVLAIELSAGLSAERADAQTIDIDKSFEVTGRVDDIVHSTQSSGYTFNVGLQGLHYKGQVSRTLLEPKEDGRTTLWLALRDVTLTIDRTVISGRPGSANCGPTQILMGCRRDLWIAFDLESRSHDQQSQFALTGVRLGLPNDNWSVGSPAWIQTQGFGMTRSKVSSGISSGLVRNRHRFEQELIKVAPRMLASIVPNVDVETFDQQRVLNALQTHLVAAGHLGQTRE